jgi:hypothetical protein
MSSPAEQRQAERLLGQIRRRVARFIRHQLGGGTLTA